MDEQERQKKKIEILMKDYELLKTYSTISSPGIRYNIISFALATIGIIISGTMFALSSGSTSPFVIKVIMFLLSLFLPAFCLTILLIWLGEEKRMLRIGKFCQRLENRINLEFGGEEILNWETFKRKKSESIMFPEIFLIALFLGTSLGSSLTGFYIAKNVFGYHFLLGKCSFNLIWLSLIWLIAHILIGVAIFLFAKRNFIHEKPISDD
jgi:hypothetical protein